MDDCPDCSGTGEGCGCSDCLRVGGCYVCNFSVDPKFRPPTPGDFARLEAARAAGLLPVRKIKLRRE